jgi:hypothetical protein
VAANGLRGIADAPKTTTEPFERHMRLGRRRVTNMTAPTEIERRVLRPATSWKVALLLALLPGVGHAYVGYPKRGFRYLLTIGSLVTVLSMNVLGRIEPIDVYRLAQLRSRVSVFDQGPVVVTLGLRWRWLLDWWPRLFVVVGLVLLAEALAERE